MQGKEFPRWVELARKKGAHKLIINRARKGGAAQGVFDELLLGGLDAEALLARLREDVAEGRRISVGVYELAAQTKDGDTVLTERITVARDEQEPVDADPQVAATRIYLTETRAAFSEMRATVRDAREMMGAANDCLRLALDATTKQNSDFMGKLGETLSMVFEVAQLKKEREDAVQLSADRRAMWSKGLEELGPIVGSALAKWSKKSGPAFMSFFQSIKPEQLAVLQQTLTKEQVANLGTLLEVIEQEKRGAS